MTLSSLRCSNPSDASFFCIIFQLVNNGPSQISETFLELRCPLRSQNHNLLYPLKFSTEGLINCTADKNMNHLRLKVSDTSQDQMGWSQTVNMSHRFPVRCMINSGMLPLAVPHPPPPPSFSAPPRTLTPPLLWCSSSSLCWAQLDAISTSNILTDLQHVALRLLYQVVSLGFCGQNILVQLFVFTFEAWQMLCRVVTSHLS